MSTKLVSIIIPSYNSKRWVCDAIDCSLQQTYPKCELIVVDDGSTDGTRDLLSLKYGDSIRYIYQDNKGLSGARNTGLDHAKGDYIQFLDADDLIEPDKIELHVKSLDGNSSLALSYSDFVYTDIDNNGRILNNYLLHTMDLRKPLIDLISLWEFKMSIPPHCFFFSSYIFKLYNIRFDETLPNHEDWDCWIRILSLNPKISYIDKVLAQYRQHGHSMCKNRKMMRKGFLMAIEKQMTLHKSNPEVTRLLLDKQKEVRYKYRNYGPMGVLRGMVPQKFRAFYRKLRGVI